MDVADSTGEGEKVQQRASLLSSATDFSFCCRRGGSRNNMSKLGGAWGGEGVVRGEEAGNRVQEVFKEERVWVSAGKKYSGIVDTCRGEHLFETVQV